VQAASGPDVEPHRHQKAPSIAIKRVTLTHFRRAVAFFQNGDCRGQVPVPLAGLPRRQDRGDRRPLHASVAGMALPLRQFHFYLAILLAFRPRNAEKLCNYSAEPKKLCRRTMRRGPHRCQHTQRISIVPSGSRRIVVACACHRRGVSVKVRNKTSGATSRKTS